jgi:hypothetical protein
MQLTSTLSYLLYAASIVVAAPVEKRQFSLGGGGGSTRNDVKDGKCAPVTLIFARGSTEPGVSTKPITPSPSFIAPETKQPPRTSAAPSAPPWPQPWRKPSEPMASRSKA